MEEFRVRFFSVENNQKFPKIRYIQKVLATPDFQRYIPIPLKKAMGEREEKGWKQRIRKTRHFKSTQHCKRNKSFKKIQEARSIVILLEASLEMLQDDRIETDALKVVREKLSEVTQLLR